MVNAWEENPWNTEAFFVVPRVFQNKWGRVSKQVVEVATFGAGSVPAYGDNTDIPCVLLHLPCYVRRLPRPQPKGAPHFKTDQWHRDQAEHVRGLS